MRGVCVLKFGSVGWPVGQSCNPTACLCITCQMNRADSFQVFTSRKCLVLRSRSTTCLCLRYTCQAWLAVVCALRPNYNSRLSVERFWTGHFQNRKSFLSLLLLMGNCFVWCDIVGECELCAAGSSVFSFSSLHMWNSEVVGRFCLVIIFSFLPQCVGRCQGFSECRGKVGCE